MGKGSKRRPTQVADDELEERWRKVFGGSRMSKKLNAAFTAAVQDEVSKHHQAGRSVPIWRDGKLVYLEPEDPKMRPLSRPKGPK